MQAMEKVEITIVGAGVVGLAIALELSGNYRDVFVIEQESSFGHGTSSRNSEVIHAGIYYPKDSLKAKTCVEGRRMIYEFCLKHHIAHKRIGKLIVATDGNEVEDLEALFRRGLDNGVEDLRMLAKKEVKDLEPHVEAMAAIYSPSTGILDTHGLMKHYAMQFEDNDGAIVYNTEVIGIDKADGGFEVTTRDNRGETVKFFTRVLINAAGLNADKVASLAGLAKDEYRLKYCKGDYLRVHPGKAKLINRLVYPVPKKAGAGLGIHATPDLAGGLRLGPDDEYIGKPGYVVDSSKIRLFYESVRDFLPFIDPEDLSVDMAGIRPKLQGPGESFRDFIIKDEMHNGFPGLIDLIGIESPGLTGSLSIAGMVKKMVTDLMN
jgi:L-2-hydroxyglutarate oxidase LhgO